MKRFISVFLIFVMITSIIITSVSAANVCYDVRGDLNQTVQFKATVGNKWYYSDKIVLQQTAGTSEQSFYGHKKNFDRYGGFYVSVYDDTSKTWVYKDEYWKDKKFTIKSSQLKKKHSYTITVRGDTVKNVADHYDKFPYVFRKWISIPKWSASKTGGNITFCGY